MTSHHTPRHRPEPSSPPRRRNPIVYAVAAAVAVLAVGVVVVATGLAGGVLPATCDRAVDDAVATTTDMFDRLGSMQTPDNTARSPFETLAADCAGHRDAAWSEFVVRLNNHDEPAGLAVIGYRAMLRIVCDPPASVGGPVELTAAAQEVCADV